MHLYLIQSDKTGSIKIGRSDHPQIRLKQLQTGAAFELKLLAIIDGAGHLEKQIHKQLKEYRLQGEWFHWDILRYLDDFITEHLDWETEYWWNQNQNPVKYGIIYKD